MTLKARLADKSAHIGVVGLGYVGLPLSMEFARKGFSVTGFDVDRARVKQLKAGHSYVRDVLSPELSRWTKAGRFQAHDRFEALAQQDVVFVCVQTPLRKTREPDITKILAAIREIAGRPRFGRLIVLESTTFPGTTEEIVLPILAEKGRLGKDFFLAFSPERVDPGNRNFGIANTPKVVGGADPASTELAVAVYSQIVERVVPVSSPRAAEVVKLLENTFRATNIALVNEMAQICRRLGLDVWEIIAAAATKPFGFMPFYPGPGIGGHCIPKDPHLLSWKMQSLNFDARFINLASLINGGMPEYAVRRIAESLNGARKALNGSRILVLGVAYKPDIGDYRESPALDVMELLLKAGARVSYCDPYVPEAAWGSRRLKAVRLTDAALKAADCAVILTAHRDVDYARVARQARLIFDARGATRGLDGRGKIQRL